MTTVISVENLTKRYDLGVIGTGTISRDLNRWWARIRKQPDPYTRIGQKDAFERIGESILALDDINFSVEQGEVLGIIGRNGAGKSTLLKILSRVTAPTKGCVRVRGRIGSLLEVGTGFHPELTGRENIYLNGAILGMTKLEVKQKFDEIVGFAEIEKFIDTPVKRYSSGMYVRLAFAVAAYLESEILLVDEVLAVGDAEFQKKCLGKMGDVSSREGRTVLFVSHNMGAVRSLCSRGILLKNGSISSDRVIDETIKQYNFIQNNSDFSKQIFRPRKDCTHRIIINDVSVTTPKSYLDPLIFSMEYSANEPVDYFTVEWFIKDAYGNRIISCLSSLKDNMWFYPNGLITDEIISTIQNWQFPGGNYSISVMITNPGIECFDYLEDAIKFSINDMYPNSSFQFSNRYGYFLPDTIWKSGEKTVLKKYETN